MKKFAIGLLVVIVLLFAVGFIMPSKKVIERTEKVNASQERVFAEVADLKSWKNWDPWYPIDSNQQRTVEGKLGDKGYHYSWTSQHEDVGNGKFTVTEYKEPSELKYRIDFEGMGSSDGWFRFDKVSDNETEVTWAIEMEVPSWKFWEVMFLNFAADGMLGDDFSKGIAQLGKEIEGDLKPEKARFAVSDVHIEDPIYYLAIKQEASREELGEIMGQLYGEISSYMSEQNIESNGHPLAVYHKQEDGSFQVECGIPVKNNSVSGNDRISLETLEAGNALKAVHHGDYSGLHATHEFFQNYIDEHHVRVFGDPWEVYVTDPEKEKDVTKWVTEVYYPI